MSTLISVAKKPILLLTIITYSIITSFTPKNLILAKSAVPDQHQHQTTVQSEEYVPPQTVTSQNDDVPKEENAAAAPESAASDPALSYPHDHDTGHDNTAAADTDYNADINPDRPPDPSDNSPEHYEDPDTIDTNTDRNYSYDPDDEDGYHQDSQYRYHSGHNAVDDAFITWDTELTGFDPQTVTSFYIPGGTSEHYFHDVRHAPELLRGGFFVDGVHNNYQQNDDNYELGVNPYERDAESQRRYNSYDYDEDGNQKEFTGVAVTAEDDPRFPELSQEEQNKIVKARMHKQQERNKAIRAAPKSEENLKSVNTEGFHILDPDGKLVPFDKTTTEGMFVLTALKNGTYSMIMPNPLSSDRVATFAFQYAAKKDVDRHLAPHHFDALDKKVDDLSIKLREIENESTYLWLHQKSHLKSVVVLNTRTWWFAALQFLVLMFMTSFQIYYIRALIQHKKVTMIL